jgi:tetratricopeptide (TPR) repeat protein
MNNPFARAFIGHSYKAVAWLRRACPPPVRQRLRRLLGGRAVAVIDYLIVSNAVVRMRQHERAMVAAGPDLADKYHQLLAGNAADLMLEVMQKFYTDLGVEASSIPLVQALNRYQRKSRVDLSERRGEAVADGAQPGSNSSNLIRFETAWMLYRHQRHAEALKMFESIFRDTSARKQSARDPFVKEAVVRSGEILARHHDTAGKVEQAIAIYREITALDPDGVMARRLAVLLSRRGDLSEAAQLAESIVFSRPNLFPYLQSNPYVASLKEELSRKSEMPD